MTLDQRVRSFIAQRKISLSVGVVALFVGGLALMPNYVSNSIVEKMFGSEGKGDPTYFLNSLEGYPANGNEAVEVVRATVDSKGRTLDTHLYDINGDGVVDEIIAVTRMSSTRYQICYADLSPFSGNDFLVGVLAGGLAKRANSEFSIGAASGARYVGLNPQGQ